MSGSRASLEPIEAIAHQLLTASLAKSTWESYTRAIEGSLDLGVCGVQELHDPLNQAV